MSIQTNSNDKSKIFLKAGQKVIVLKSPRGICLQLESGKVIAIRASLKPGQLPGDLKTPSFPGITDALEAVVSNPIVSSLVAKRSSEDIIDMTNSDDEESAVNFKGIEEKATLHPINGDGILSVNLDSQITGNNDTVEETFKEKAVYKPNLVQRKPKMPPPSTIIAPMTSLTTATTTTSSMYSHESNKASPYTSNYHSQNKMSWNRFSSNHSSGSSSSTLPASSSNYYRNMNGGKVGSSSKTEQTTSYQNNRKFTLILN